MAVNPKQTNANRANNFGSFFHDVNHQIGTGYPNYPYYQDTTPTTPNQSPLSITTAATQLEIPAGAVTVNFIGTVAFRVSDQSGLATTKPYATFPANTLIPIPVAWPTVDPGDTSGFMWVAADTTSGVLSFFFSCI